MFTDSKYKLRRKQLFSLGLFLIAAVGLTVFSTYKTYISELALVQQKLKDAAEDQIFALEEAFDSNVTTLKALAGLYAANRDVDRHVFHEIADTLLRNSAIQALEWVPLIPYSERKKYEQAAQRDGYPVFEIKELNEQGQMVRAGKRKEYLPVYYLEPYKGNEAALGLDLASSAPRLQAIRHSINIGGSAATEGINLVQERSSQCGFLLFYPVYNPGILDESVVPDSSGLRGFVLGVFRISDIVERALSGFTRAGLSIGIKDMDASSSGRLLGVYSDETMDFTAHEKKAQNRPLTEKMIDVGGRSWKIYVTHPGAVAATHGHVLVLISGLLLTGAVSMLMISVFRRNVKIEQTVVAKTAELKILHQQVRELAAHLLTFREEERTTIAREIHDELGQILTAIKMELCCFRSNYRDQTAVFDKVEGMMNTLNEAILSVKRICAELRPSLLDDFGLVAALEWQANEFQRRIGIECTFCSEPEDIELDKERSTALYRIFQEGLTNVLKHANATKVTARLIRDNDQVILEVMDNGKGITDEELSKPQSFGIIGMRERVYPWGGAVEITGAEGRGTTVRVFIPPATQKPSMD